MKNKTPSGGGGRIKPWSGGKDKAVSQVSTTDIDAISVSSNNSGLDPLIITGKTTGSTSSGPTSGSSYAASKNTVDGPALQGQSGPHPTKVRRNSEDSYMTALSQDTTTSSQGNLELSQDSGQSAPVRPKTAPIAKSSKPQIRGRPNYKVAKGPSSDRADDSKSRSDNGVRSDGGARGDSGGSNETFDYIPPSLRTTDAVPANTDTVASKTKFKPSRVVNGILPSQATATTTTAASVKSTATGFAPAKLAASRTAEFAPSKASGGAHGETSTDSTSTQTSGGSPVVPVEGVSGSRSISRPPGFPSSSHGASYLSPVDNLVSANQQGLTPGHSLSGSFSGTKDGYTEGTRKKQLHVYTHIHVHNVHLYIIIHVNIRTCTLYMYMYTILYTINVHVHCKCVHILANLLALHN